jgi:hypothetical protein
MPPRRFSGRSATLDALPPRVVELSLPVAHLRCMLSPEEYRKRAKEARQQANTCCSELERQGLLMIADQCERIAAYKNLTTRSAAASKNAEVCTDSDTAEAWTNIDLVEGGVTNFASAELAKAGKGPN